MRKPILLLTTGAALLFSFLIYQSIERQESEKANPYAHQLALYEKTKGMSLDEIEALPKYDRPDLALLQEFETTKDLRLGYPPIQRKLEAFKIAKQKLASKTSARGIANVTWDERGPNNVGGRTRALMFDPNDGTNKKVWAGGVSGGIWYNTDITDADVQWINVDDFMTNLSISSLAYDPQSTTTFYAGTGESWTSDFRGTGIWKSTDAGSTWSQLSSTADFGYVTKIVITSSSVIVVSTSKGIKTSSDGGATWTAPDGVKTDMSDLELAANGDLICAGFSGNIHKSTDNGSTWSDISPGLDGRRVEVSFAPTNSSVIYAASAIREGASWIIAWMAKSTNGGTDWTEITIPKYLSQDCTESDQDFARGQSWYDLILGVSPADENDVIVGGIDLHRSTDGGSIWKSISYWTGACGPYVHADQHAIAYRPGTTSEAIFGNDGGVFYSPDIDQASPKFFARNNHYNVTQFYALAMRDEINSNDMLAGAQDNGTQKFSTHGMNATVEATGGDGGYCFIDQDNPQIQLTSYVYNNYRISRDGGFSFTNFGTGDTGGFINQCDYDDKANILYARGENSDEINRYAIGESNITTTTVSVTVGGNVSHILVSPFEDNVLYVGAGGRVSKVINANADTPEATELNIFEGAITSIDVHDNGNKILVTVGNYGSISVHYSDDAGANWTNIEGDLPDMPVWWGIFNPNNSAQVILATEVGVWSSDDITASSVVWDPTNEGLANVSTRMIQHRKSDGFIGVATHGRGLYTSSSFSQTSYADFISDRYITYVGKEVSFTNVSLGAITSANWSLSDGAAYTTTDFTHTFTEPGWHTITLDLNGELTKSKRVFVLPKRPVNYACELENEPIDTYANNLRGSIGFELGNSAISGKDGVTSGANAWVLGLDDAEYSDESESHIYLPEFDFTAAGNYSFSFQTKYSFEANWDGFIVEYSTDQGETWTKLGDAIEDNWYNQITDPRAVFGAEVPIFSGATIGYELKQKDVSFLAGNSTVTFKVVYMSDANTVDVGMAIDDFKVTGPTSTIVPNFSTVYRKEYCTGSTVTFHNNTSIGASSYAWDFGADASPATATGAGPHDVTYSAGGNKTVSLTVDGTFTETKMDFLHIGESLTSSATIILADDAICAGEEGVILVQNSEVGKFYQVFVPGSEDPYSTSKEGTGGELTFSLGNPQTAVSYFVEISQDGFCKLQSDELAVSISSLEEIPFTVSETKVCEGETVNVTLNSSVAGLDYQLYQAGTETSSGNVVVGTGNSITLTTDILTETSIFDIKVNDSNAGCSLIFTKQAEVVVNTYPEVTITASDATLSVAEGAEGYTWYKDGFAIGGSNSNTYTVTSNGEYYVIASNGACSSTSETKKILVTSVNDPSLAAFDVYPNPSKGVLNIKSAEPMSFKLYSMAGHLLMIKSEREISENQVDISKLENGIYILECIKNGTSTKQKIVLNKN